MSDLSERLAALNVTCTATHMGLVEGDSPHAAQDEWRVTVKVGKSEFGTKYSTGLGHRKLATGVKAEGEKYVMRNTGDVARNILDAAKKGWLRTTQPNVADVVHCLLSDASGVDQPFGDWASDLGYSDDSIRALNIYLECQKTRKALEKLFGAKLFEELAALEH